MVFKTVLTVLSMLVASSFASAHDTWVEAGPLSVRQGEYVYVNLMLGNHGNQHRDFRLASKITLAPCSLQVLGPDGQPHDLKPSIIDMGSAEKEGFWTARFEPHAGGLYEVIHTLDTLHGTTRAVKSAKTYFVVESGAEQRQAMLALPAALGHGLELVLHTNTINLAAGSEVRLQVLRSGQPLPAAHVAFVPRGTELNADFDERHERTSDANGFVSYVPAEGNVYLAIAHVVAAEERGQGYDKTHYSAAMVLPIPNHALAK